MFFFSSKLSQLGAFTYIAITNKPYSLDVLPSPQEYPRHLVPNEAWWNLIGSDVSVLEHVIGILLAIELGLICLTDARACGLVSS